jgi:hypothetical protein
LRYLKSNARRWDWIPLRNFDEYKRREMVRIRLRELEEGELESDELIEELSMLRETHAEMSASALETLMLEKERVCGNLSGCIEEYVSNIDLVARKLIGTKE